MKFFLFYVSVATLLFINSQTVFALDTPFPDNELICGNLRQTDTSLHVKILSTKPLSNNPKGYVEYEYKAIVLEVYKGNFKVNQEITYNETREADLPPKLPLGEKIISLMQNKGATWDIPDNGYAFKYEASLGDRYKKLAMTCSQKGTQLYRQEASPN